jgi:hypothetical protein
LAFAFEIRSVGKSDRHKKVYQYFSLPNGIWNRCSVAYKPRTSYNETMARREGRIESSHKKDKLVD